MDRINRQEVVSMKKRLERALVALADEVSKKNVNSACCLVFYQPELPESLKKKYKK